MLYNVPPCLVLGEVCVISLTILGETADCGGRIDDAVFPSVSMEGEMTAAKQLLIMDVIVLVFTSQVLF
jgi:hypothetical protein